MNIPREFGSYHYDTFGISYSAIHLRGKDSIDPNIKNSSLTVDALRPIEWIKVNLTDDDPFLEDMPNSAGVADTGAPQRLIDQCEDRPRLRLEVRRNIVAGLVLKRGLPGEPDGLAALRDHRGRIAPRFLAIGLIEIFGHYCLPVCLSQA